MTAFAVPFETSERPIHVSHRATVMDVNDIAGHSLRNFMKTKSATILEFIEKVLNQGNIDATDDYFWENVVEEVPLPGQGPGLQGLKDVLRGMRSAFPDMHWVVEEQIESENKVASRFTWTGTHRAAFFGVPATGRRVTVWGIVIDQFDGQKIKSTRIIMDGLGLMAQLGAFPPAK